jgi:hypothetical protein
MLSYKVPLFSPHPCQSYRALPLEKLDDRRHRLLGRDGDAEVNMVRHEVSFDDGAFLLPCQFVKDWAEGLTKLPKQDLSAAFGDENNVILDHSYNLSLFTRHLIGL